MNLFKSLILASCCLFFTAAGIFAQTAEVEKVTVVPLTAPSGTQLLQQVIMRLPTNKVELSGTVIVKKMRGTVINEYDYELFADWNTEPTIVRYGFNDAKGKNIEALDVRRGRDGSVKFNYSKEGKETAELPDMYNAILDSDVSWIDLTLGFLWWKDAKNAGEESVKGFDCYVVDVTAPDSEKGLYAKVRVWIHKKQLMLIRADGMNGKGETVRSLWIDSIVKIKDRWMLKDMEIKTEDSGHKTMLTVKHVKLDGEELK